MTDLNDAQQGAVTEGDGAALVLAGAGSGKTRVIVERLAWLVQKKNVNTRNILALTFTNRAANEMKERIAKRLGVDSVAAWVGTFHSFGLFMLRRDIDKLGRKKTFTIFDDADQMALMKRLIKDLPQGATPVLPREALGWISNFKQKLQTPGLGDVTDSTETETLRRLWGGYHAQLERAGGVDFDDLLVLPAKLLQQSEDVRKYYGERYQFVHIDEYQDTNHAQYEIARLLSKEHGNIFAVGDEDQSIYSWRGADINNILQFEQDFPNARVFRLEQNYRSTEAILRVANAVVANNTMRLGKTLWTAQKGGDKVRLNVAFDGDEEARQVTEEIQRRHLPLDGVGVLFRTNGQSRAIEEALRRAALPYVVVGATEFYGRKEVKDLLAYLRLLANPADDVSLRRVINVPSRGIGATSFERIEEYAKQRNVSLLQVLRDTEHDQSIPARTRASISEFLHIRDELAIAAKTTPIDELVKKLVERIAYRQFVQQSDERDFRARLEIVDEFISSCAKQDGAEQDGLIEFLQNLSLFSDNNTEKPDGPVVTLMTCHSAKGLEFDHVFLVGLEEGLLPHASSFDSEVEMEEERRLCYVAMTRARKTLTLSMAQQRTVFGERREGRPSRFLSEVPRDWIEANADRDVPRERAAKPSLMPTAQAGGGAGLKTGSKVRHPTFGSGVVVNVSGAGARLKARIRFASGPARDFLVASARLEIL